MNKNIGEMTNNELKNFIIELQEQNSRYERVLNEIKDDIIFCINCMKNEYACTDSRTNRELHTMVKILEELLQIIDKVLGDDEK